MIDIVLPPFLAALCKSCETVCVRECCGIEAFSFSPFNIIYHLTKLQRRSLDSEIADIRLELADLATRLRTSDLNTENLVLADLNAILTIEQVFALIDEIDFALTEGRAIYCSQEERIDARYRNFLRIIRAPK